MNLANEEEAKAWKRIMEIANGLSSLRQVAVSDSERRFGLLKPECRRIVELELPPGEIFWEQSPMKFFLDRHEAEIKDWIREHIPYISFHSSSG